MKIQYNKRHWKPGILSIMLFILFIPQMKAQLTDKYEGCELNVYKGMPYGLHKPARLPSPSQIYDKIVWLGGKKVKYTEYMDIKHKNWEDVSPEKELNKWLFSQEKGK